MAGNRYIQVLLPLKLEWEPYYALPEGMSAAVGDTVTVEFAHRRYEAVVTAVDVTPDDGLDVKSVIETPGTAAVSDDASSSPDVNDTSSPDAFRGALPFWRELSAYYLCTPGEVYKVATVKTKILPRETPGTVARSNDASSSTDATGPSSTDAFPESQITAAFSEGKTVLLTGSGREEIYTQFALETLASGRSVLQLVPTRKKKQVFELAKNGNSRWITGTKNALFTALPDLGLVIVDEEQDPSFKQDSPAPRYGAREAAIMLAKLHGANVILGSETPSLESLYNAETGLFKKINLKQSKRFIPSIINTTDETRKKGMSGSFSLKLLDKVKNALDNGEKVLIVCRSKQVVQEAQEELKNIFPEAAGKSVVFTFQQGLKTIDFKAFSLTVFMQADSLLGKEDFRCDERALQLLSQLSLITRLVIQTRESEHPVFKALQDGKDALVFLEERRLCNLPPFSRLVNIVYRDKNEKRIKYLSQLLSREITGTGPYAPSFDSEDEHIRIIRITLPKDKTLKSRKAAIYQAVKQFEKDHGYTGHIVIDVDPV